MYVSILVLLYFNSQPLKEADGMKIGETYLILFQLTASQGG